MQVKTKWVYFENSIDRTHVRRNETILFEVQQERERTALFQLSKQESVQRDSSLRLIRDYTS